MRRLLLSGYAVLLSLGIPACGGGDGGDGGTPNPPVANLESITSRLQMCALVRTGDLTRLLELLDPLFRAPGDEDLADEWGITIAASSDAGDPPHTYLYTIPFDLDGDGTEDAVVEGKITFDQDPTQGAPPASMADLTWDLTAANGEVTGSGSLHLALEESGTMLVSGEGSISDARDGCMFDFFVDAAAPLMLARPLVVQTLRADPSRAFELPAGITVDGCVEISVEVDGNVYAGTVCYSDPDELCIVNATVNGRSVPDQCFLPLPRTNPEFVQLIVCATAQVRVLGALVEAAERVMLAYNDVPTGPGGVSITFPDRNDFLQFDFAVDIDLDGDLRSDRLEGSVDVDTSRIVWEVTESATMKGSSGNMYFIYSLRDWENPTEGGTMTVTSAFADIHTAENCSLVLSIVPGGDAQPPLMIEFDGTFGVTDVSGGIDRFVVNGESLALVFRANTEENPESVVVWSTVSPGNSFEVTIPGS